MSDRSYQLISELNGDRCRCGAGKKTGKTFCGRCYHSLPILSRRALYQRIGSGYESAYDRAVAFLAKNGRVRSDPES